MAETSIRAIGHIENDFTSKFGIPRQSGMIAGLKSRIVFEPEFCLEQAFRGLEGFSHLWIIWEFSENKGSGWSEMVRPPRLGGNKKMGVFATRSPFRPNPLGLSCVKIEKIENTKNKGTVIHISGADLMNGTPIFDVKPYVKYTDCIPEAVSGFAESEIELLEVNFPEELLQKVPKDKRENLILVLKNDPRPSYQRDENRVYAFEFGEMKVEFRVEEKTVEVVGINRE